MKAWVKALVPRSLIRAYHRRKVRQEDGLNASRTPEDVFSEIYRQGTWGKGAQPFCSGLGSADEGIVGPYLATIRTHLLSRGGPTQTVVDLGCGDFSVGRQLVNDCAGYIGIDVVPDLVRHLQASVSDANVTFFCLDIVRDDLPPGDVCLIRQVLQHLSNAQIGAVLSKLSRYHTVFITEHQPDDTPSVVPNRDKVHGGGIRLFANSGVYLDRPPFNIPSTDLELVLEVPGHGFNGLYNPGVIRTFKYTPAARSSRGSSRRGRD